MTISFCLTFFSPLRSLSSSSTWWELHLRQPLGRAPLPLWPRHLQQFTMSASRPLPRHNTSSHSGPLTLQPPPHLQRFARRAGTSSSTLLTQTSVAVSRNSGKLSSRRNSSNSRRSSNNRTHSCLWRTVQLPGSRTRRALPKRTRARQRLQRRQQTHPQKAPRSLSHNCSRHSSICSNQAINRSVYPQFI